MKAEEKKSLIILIPGFPTNESDSTCLPAQQTFLLALKRNYPAINLAVITFQYPYRFDRYEWNGIPVFSLNGRNKGGFVKLRTWMRAWHALRKLKKNQSLMLLSFWCSDCAFIGKWYAKFNKLRHSCWVLGQDAKKENGMVKLIRPKPTELIALSPFLQEEFFKNHGIRPASVIPNAIDTRSFLPTSAKRTIDVIGVGSLIPLKQYNVFVSVLKKVVDVFPALQAIICGEGPEFDSLKRMIVEAGLKRNIQLVGENAHEEVLLLFQLSKILLHPSSYEGYSSVCLEALYAGAHVVSFRTPTAAAIEHWHVVNSEEAMQEKVIELLSNTSLDHKRILVHSVDDSANAIVNLFDGVS